MAMVELRAKELVAAKERSAKGAGEGTSGQCRTGVGVGLMRNGIGAGRLAGLDARWRKGWLR